MAIYIDDIDNLNWKPDIDTHYRTIDGLKLPIQIFYPEDHKKQYKRTAVLCIHGGAWSARTDNSKWDGNNLITHARYFASRGAIGIVISYRGIASLESIEKGLDGNSIADLYSDCREAVRYLRINAEEFGIDANKIVALGDSAGAWIDWKPGMEVQKSDTVVSNGHLYRVKADPDGII